MASGHLQGSFELLSRRQKMANENGYMVSELLSKFRSFSPNSYLPVTLM